MVDTTISSCLLSSKSAMSDSVMKFSRSDTYFVLYSASNVPRHLNAMSRSILFLNLPHIYFLALSHTESEMTLVAPSLIMPMNE